MTEAGWLTCGDPAIMLRSVWEEPSDRKGLLFACACCRRIWSWLVDERSRKALEGIENGVESEFESDSRLIARRLASEGKEVVANEAYARGFDVFHPTIYAAEAVFVLSFFSNSGAVAISSASECARTVAAVENDEAKSDALLKAEKLVQANILRDILGNPFRTVDAFPTWIEWNDGTVPRIAQVIYEKRAFDRMPILADALEDAGCGNADILNHCRSGGEHVRGCWVVDLLLGKT